MTILWPIALFGALALCGWALTALLLPSPLVGRARRFRPAPAKRAWAQMPIDVFDSLARLVLPPPSRERLNAAQMRARQAGWSQPEAGPRLLAASWLLSAILAMIALATQLSAFWAAPLQALLITGLAATAGYFAPAIYATNLAERRRRVIAQGLPDAIDLLIICAEAGLSIEVALARAARELAPAQPLLAAELAMTATELGLLPNRADGFANLARRLALPQVVALCDMLVQTERFGTPLVQSLRILGTEYRGGRLLRAEEQAAKLPALMTVPMITFILPPLFIVLIGPAIIGAMHG